MAGTAFHLTFEHWPSILLALIPAVLNLFVLAFIYMRLPRNKLTNIFSLTVVCIFGWQLLDAAIRASATVETAELWLRTLWIFVLLVTPVAMHFVLLFTDRGHYLKSQWIILLMYGPAFFFEAAMLLNFLDLKITTEQFWNHTVLPTNDLLVVLQYMWLTFNAIFIAALLITHLLYTKPDTTKFKQSLLISIGFFIPILQGVITQFLMPYFLDASDIPVTSSFMSTFSIVTLIALARFSLFKFSPEHASNKILATMNDALCVVNMKNEIRFVNDSFCELAGYSKIELEEFNYTDLLSGESFDHYLLEISKLKAYEREGQFELEFITKPGIHKWVLMTITPFITEGPEENGYIKIHRDITDRKKHIQEIKDKSKELSTFFYRTSHDLRGPLTSIMGLVNMIKKDGTEGKEMKQMLQMLERSTVKLDQILDQLINVAEINEGTLHPKPTDVKGVVRSAIAAAKQYTDKSVQIEVIDELKKPSTIDKNYLWQVAYHLIKNAIQFNDKDVVVVNIRMWQYNGQLKIEVQDNGPGIPKEIQPHIYEMFYRGDRNLSGSGLGLYLVEKAINKLNGTVEFTSTSKGTVFTVTLPLSMTAAKKRVVSK